MVVDGKSILADRVYQLRHCRPEDLKIRLEDLVFFLENQVVMCSVSDVINDLMTEETVEMVKGLEKAE